MKKDLGSRLVDVELHCLPRSCWVLSQSYKVSNVSVCCACADSAVQEPLRTAYTYIVLYL
jgi:hypothetical protein